jgi:hypothetical protein
MNGSNLFKGAGIEENTIAITTACDGNFILFRDVGDALRFINAFDSSYDRAFIQVNVLFPRAAI